MTNRNKERGSSFERDVVNCFHERGHTQVERRYGAGAQSDKGDINGIKNAVVECKDLAKITMSTIADEAALERDNAKVLLGIFVIKRRRRSAKDAYFCLSLEDGVTLLEMAGLL